MMYLSQIITMYFLNLCSAVCQLYLNKAGREKKEVKFLMKNIWGNKDQWLL